MPEKGLLLQAVHNPALREKLIDGNVRGEAEEDNAPSFSGLTSRWRGASLQDRQGQGCLGHLPNRAILVPLAFRRQKQTNEYD